MKHASGLRRWLVIAATLSVAFALIVTFAFPPIVRSQLEKRLSAQLGRKVTVAEVRLNPFTLAATINRFAIQEREPGDAFLGWRRLYVNVNGWSSIWGEWVVSQIDLEGLEGRVVVNADGSLNFSDILQKFSSPAAAPPRPDSSSSRPVRIGSLNVIDARLDLADRSRAQPFATQVGPVTFALTEFRTTGGRGAPYRFEAVTESGEKLLWSGTLEAAPLRSTGEFKLENLTLAKYAPYYADRMQADVENGTLTVSGRYELDLSPGKQVIGLNTGAVQVRGLKIVERTSKEAALELRRVDLTGLKADALTMKVSADTLTLDGGNVHVKRQADGSINLLTALQPSTKSPAGTPTPPRTTTASAATPLPEVKLGELGLKEIELAIDDAATPRPVQLTTLVNLSLRNVTLASDAVLPLELAVKVGAQGEVRASGSIGLKPMNANLKVSVARLDVSALSPYVEQFVNARLAKGTLGCSIAAQALTADDGQLAATVSGDVELTDFALVDAAKNEEVISFNGLSVRGLRASAAKTVGVAIEEIALTRPSAHVVMNSDRSLNVMGLRRAEKSAADLPPESSPERQNTAAATEAANRNGTKIEVGKITIDEGRTRFVDRSVEPNVALAIDHFAGTIAGVSSTASAPADVDLKAVVGDAGPVAIAGKLDLVSAKPSVDLKIDFKNVDLTPLSPYSGRYAGYELARGTLVVDTKINVAGDRVDSANVITLHHFTFGEAVKSPDATSLPVRLGVGLLKDLEGKIVIDVPVQGSTSDPNFRIGRVVLRVITNLLTKAAVSPFTLLAAAFGGGGDELAFQEFDPGSSELRADAIRKLQTTAKALANRPGLQVQLRGHYDPKADVAALRQAKVAALIRDATAKASAANSAAVAASATDEEATIIKALFNERFPPGSPQGVPVPPAPELKTAPHPPSGWFDRIVYTLSGQGGREQRAVAAENERLKSEHEKAMADAATRAPSVAEMRARLAEVITIDEPELRALADARAETVRAYFTKDGGIAADRVHFAKAGTDATKPPQGARVVLDLQ